MIQVPLLLPARLQGRYARRSVAGVVWRAIDGLTFLSGQAPTYQRSGNAWSFDTQGRLLQLVHSAPNIVMVDVDTPGGASRTRPAVLVSNYAATNGIHYAEDIAQSGTWAQTNSPAFGANDIVHGNLTLKELQDASGSLQARITQSFPANRFGGGSPLAKPLSFFVAYPSATTPAAAGGSVVFRDTTASVDRLKVLLPFSGSTPNFSASTGSIELVEEVGTYRAGWTSLNKRIYRVHARTTSSFDADNAHEIRVHAADTAAQQGGVYVGGFFMDAALNACVGYVPTPAAATNTREADNWYLGWNALPRAMTLFIDFLVLTSRPTTGYLLLLGDTDATPAFYIYFDDTSGSYTARHHNGSSLLSSGIATTPSPLSRVRLRAVLREDGSVYLGMRVQNGAETVSSPSSAQSLATTWGTTPQLQIRGPYLLLGMAALFGERSMDFCETLVR